MPSFYNLVAGAVAQAQDVQQVLDALKGTAGLGVPLSPTAVNDSVNFALAVKNTDVTNSRALQVLRANNLVLMQADVNGVIVSPDGVAAAAQVVNLSLAQTLTNKTLTSPTLTSPVVSSGGLVVTSGNLTATSSDANMRRYKASGTALVAGDFALSAGWGSTASVSVTAGSADDRGQITVTPAGTGIAANPTITLTYKDGTWTTVPFPIVARQGGSGASADLATTATVTALVIQFLGTPVSGLSHMFNWQVVG